MKFLEAYENGLLSGHGIKLPQWPDDTRLTLSLQDSLDSEGSINVINVVNGLG